MMTPPLTHRWRLASASAVVFTTLILGTLTRIESALALDKIYSPQVVQGEAESEYFGTRTFDPQSDRNDLQEHEISIGYGVTDWWSPEFYALLERAPDEGVKMSGMQLENRFKLVQPGKYWVDTGLLLAYTRSTDGASPDRLEIKILLERQWGRILSRVNIGGEQELGRNAQSAPDRVLLWGNRYLLDDSHQDSKSRATSEERTRSARSISSNITSVRRSTV
jgi:hypothetical protein